LRVCGKLISGAGVRLYPEGMRSEYKPRQAIQPSGGGISDMDTTLKEKPMYCRSCLKAWYDNTEVVISAFLLCIAVSGAVGFMAGDLSNRPDKMIQAGRQQLWREAVEAGHAIEVETTNGSGYAWKER